MRRLSGLQNARPKVLPGSACANLRGSSPRGPMSQISVSSCRNAIHELSGEAEETHPSWSFCAFPVRSDTDQIVGAGPQLTSSLVPSGNQATGKRR